MPTVQHRSPVAARHPVTEQFITLAKGMEFDDDDPIVKAFGWAFEPDDSDPNPTSVEVAPAPKRARKA